jgi:CheY-like chemotaxis protein
MRRAPRKQKFWIQNNGKGMLMNKDDVRILVVDDCAANQDVADALLNELGYTHIDIALTGTETLGKVDTVQYHIVFMDGQMPDMDGCSITRSIRQRKHSSDQTDSQVYIVAMTANALVGDREKCLAAGMNDYISKPVKLTHLRDAIGRWENKLPTKSPNETDREKITLSDSELIDFERFNEITLNDPARKGKILNIYFRDSEPIIDQLKAAIEKQELSVIKELTHKWGGICASVGIIGVRKPLSEMERKIREGISEGFEELLLIAEENHKKAKCVLLDACV